MIRHLRAWWTLLELGPARRGAGEIEQYFRYYVIKQLQDEGLFDYLEQRHTYGEILAEFDYADGDYVREMLDLLATEKHNVLIKSGSSFQRNPAEPLPNLEALLKQNSPRFHNFTLLAEGMAQNIHARLRHEPVEFTQTFEEQGRELLTVFDDLLGNLVYTVGRKTAFALLKAEEREWLAGKQMLDVGCGSGREPVELWLRLDGEMHLTAVDPVEGLVQRAEADFMPLLEALAPDHPPVTNGNRPAFKVGSATELPFDDDSFDATFYSQMMHWTYDPRVAIGEVIRVTRPGGLVFGIQTCKPYAGLYTDLAIRTNENSHGIFWKEEHQRWYAEHGAALEVVTPGGAFRTRLPEA